MLRVCIPFICLLACSSTSAQSDLLKKLYNTKMSDEELDKTPGFTMTGEVGLLFAQGNTKTSTLKTGLSASHELEDWSNQYKADLLYRQQEQTNDSTKEASTVAHRLYLTAQMDYKLDKPGRRLFMFADYEDDRFDGFDYQSSFAAGWSQRLWQRDKSNLSFSMGPGYAFSPAQESAADVDEESVILRGAIEFNYKMSETAKFRQFISTETDSQGAKSRAETELTAKLFDLLAMKLSFVMRHNDNVSDDVKKLDTQTAVTLVYQFF